MSNEIERLKLKEKLDKLAWLTDSSIALPGQNRIGLDSIIGLIPVIGDLIAALISLYIVAIGIRADLPKLMMFRISLNIIFDTVIGAIPIVGDAFDIFFKSNERNVKLLSQYIDNPINSERKNRTWLTVLLLALLVVNMAFLWIVWLLLHKLLALFY